jgi:hypothetical protein
MSGKIRVSSRCGSNDGCVGIELAGDGVAMHDTKNPGSEPIRMSRQEFAALLSEIKTGALSFPQS